MNEEQLEKFVQDRLDDWLTNTLTFSSLSQEIDRRYRLNRQDFQNQASENERTQILIQDLQTRLTATQKETRRTSIKLEEMNIELEYRAYRDEVKSLESGIRQKCPMEFAQKLQSQLQSMATQQDLKTSVQAQQLLNKTFFSQQDATTKLSQMKAKFTKLFTENSSKENLHNRITALYKYHTELSKENKEIKFKIEKITEQVDSSNIEVRSMIESRAGPSDLDSIHELLESKATQEQLQSVYREFKPQITLCRKNIENFRSLLKAQEAASGRLDEILLQKCSKVDLYELGFKVEKISRHPDLEDKIDNMVNTLKDCGIKCQVNFEDNFNIKQSITEMTRYFKKSLLEKVEIEGLKDQVGQILEQMSFKADWEEISEILDDKTNMSDYRNLVSLVEGLEKNLILTITQIGAMQKIVADPLKVQGLERLQREYLSKVTQKLFGIIAVDKRVDVEGLLLGESKKVESPRLMRSALQTPLRSVTPRCRERF